MRLIRRGPLLLLTAAALGGVAAYRVFGTPGVRNAAEGLVAGPPGIRRIGTPSLDPPVETLSSDTGANRALLAAVAANDPEAVREAFADGADPNLTVTVTYPQGRPKAAPEPVPNPVLGRALGNAAGEPERARAREIFREFLKRGADVKAADERGMSAIHWAVLFEDPDLVRDVLARGADINAVTRNGFGGGNAVNLALMSTLRDNEGASLPMLRLVLERGADPNVFDESGALPLHQAAILGVPETTALLLKHGADPSRPTRQGTGNPGLSMGPGRTALSLARRSGNESVIRILTDARGAGNLTAAEAAGTGNVAALRRRLDAGLDPNGTDEDGTPYLVLAAGSGKADAVRLLLGLKADPNARGLKGRTSPLERAAMLGHVAAVRALLDAGADPNAADTRRANAPETALTRAVAAAEPEVVALLLGRGADLSKPGNKDALERLAREAGRAPRRPVGKDPKAVKRGDAAVDAQNRVYKLLVARWDVKRNGGPALSAAVDSGQFELAEDLLRRGADVNARGRDGRSLTTLAVVAVGMARHEASPQMLAGEGLTPAEARERAAEARAEGQRAMRFLRLLLAKRPPIDAGTREAVDTWGLADVRELLKGA